MIITPKIQGTGVLLSLGRRSAPWIVALAAGALFSACSGSIETPTDEYPSRGSNAAASDDDDDDTASANDDDDALAPPRPRAPAANVDDDDDDAPPARPAQPAAADDEDPPVDDEDPPAEDEPPAAPAGGGVTFANDVFPILNTACAPCHAGSGLGGNNIGGPEVDDAFEEASALADNVVNRISNGGMPPACAGGDPGDSGCVSEEDLATIEAWVEAGTPE